ncbi:MAG: aminoglycoside 6'-N-acetyltransferase [Flammeovirgaceae bacterium]
MTFEEINSHNLYALTKLMLALWPDCSLKEEYENCQRILTTVDETCFLAKEDEMYIAFIQLSVRKEYVEGANSSPVAFVEGIYVNEQFRKHGLGQQLIELGCGWGKSMGCNQIGSDAELDNQPSISFHKKSGFQEMNRVVCFLKDLR